MRRAAQVTTRRTLLTPTLPSVTAGPHHARRPYVVERITPAHSARVPTPPRLPYRPTTPTVEVD